MGIELGERSTVEWFIVRGFLIWNQYSGMEGGG